LWLAVALVLMMLAGTGSEVTASQEEPVALTLEKSIEIALQRNLSIKVAQEGVTVAEQRKKESFTEFLPKLKAEYGYRRPSENTVTFGGISVQAGDRNQYRFTGTLEQPIFTGFAILTNYQLSKLGLDVAKILLEQARQDLILQVKEAYLGIQRAEKLQEVAAQSVRQLEEEVKVAKSFYEVGMKPKVDVLDAETRLGDAKVQYIRTANNLRVAEANFNTVLRRPLETPVKIADVLTPKPYDRTYEQSEAIALSHRPEVLEAQKKVESAEKEISLAKSNFYPTVTFASNYYRRGNRPNVQGSNFVDRENWDIIAVANWTFFEWGKTLYSVNQKRAQLQQAKDALKQVEDSVRLQVKSAYLTLQAAKEAIVAAKLSVESAEENFRISQERYRGQVATSTEVLDAQTRLTTAKTNYTNALVAYDLARARLIRAMGLEEL